MAITVICGPMFSGKTEELIRRIIRAKYAQFDVAIFKPSIDTRYSSEYIQSHLGTKERCLVLSDIRTIINHLQESKKNKMIILEEAHFFDETYFSEVIDSIKNKFNVLIAGLDMDFLGRPFKNIIYAMGVATQIHKITAICVCCGQDATMTFKKVINNKRVEVGAKDLYEARCYNCWLDRERKSQIDDTKI